MTHTATSRAEPSLPVGNTDTEHRDFETAVSAPAEATPSPMPVKKTEEPAPQVTEQPAQTPKLPIGSDRAQSTETPAAAHQPSDVSRSAPSTREHAAAASGAEGAIAGASAAAASNQPDMALRQRAAQAQQLQLAFGQIVTLLLRSPDHRDQPISILEEDFIPPLAAGHYLIAQAQSKTHGHPVPVAAVVWASVSKEVDQRLAANLSEPVVLDSAEWRSGNIHWLVTALGEGRILQDLVKKLVDSIPKGQQLKTRNLDENGRITVIDLKGHNV